MHLLFRTQISFKMKTLYHAFLYVGMFLLIVLVGVQCQKDNDQIIKPETSNKTELTARAPGDTTYRPLEYGSVLKVYPNTISKCWNRKKARYEWQAVVYGDMVLPACKYQQIPIHDKIVVSDTAEIFYDSFFYITLRKIN